MSVVKFSHVYERANGDQVTVLRHGKTIVLTVTAEEEGVTTTTSIEMALDDWKVLIGHE